MRTLYGALAALAIIAGVLTAAAAVAWATTTSFQPAHQRITTSNQTPGGNQ